MQLLLLVYPLSPQVPINNAADTFFTCQKYSSIERARLHDTGPIFVSPDKLQVNTAWVSLIPVLPCNFPSQCSSENPEAAHVYSTLRIAVMTQNQHPRKVWWKHGRERAPALSI